MSVLGQGSIAKDRGKHRPKDLEMEIGMIVRKFVRQVSFSNLEVISMYYVPIRT